MIFQFVELFGFLVTVVIIAVVAYMLSKAVNWILGGGLFVVLLVVLALLWLPSPLAPVLSPLVGVVVFLWGVCLTTVLDGLNFVRNIGN